MSAGPSRTFANSDQVLFVLSLDPTRGIDSPDAGILQASQKVFKSSRAACGSSTQHHLGRNACVIGNA